MDKTSLDTPQTAESVSVYRGTPAPRLMFLGTHKLWKETGMKAKVGHHQSGLCWF